MQRKRIFYEAETEFLYTRDELQAPNGLLQISVPESIDGFNVVLCAG